MKKKAWLLFSLFPKRYYYSSAFCDKWLETKERPTILFQTSLCLLRALWFVQSIHFDRCQENQLLSLSKYSYLLFKRFYFCFQHVQFCNVLISPNYIISYFVFCVEDMALIVVKTIKSLFVLKRLLFFFQQLLFFPTFLNMRRPLT